MVEPFRKIEEAIKNREPSAKNFQHALAFENFVEGSVYYVEFKKDLKAGEEDNDEDDFFYVLVHKKGTISLFDDGIEVLQRLQWILNSRRSIIQRINEFSLVEMIGAIIAIAVTMTFVGIIVFKGTIDKEFVAIFSIILGYYFGKDLSK